MSISFPYKGLKEDGFTFTSQALRVAVAAADGPTGPGFLILVAAVVLILILIGACFIDTMWLKESVPNADQPFPKQSTKLLGQRKDIKEPSPATTPGSVVWRSFKPGPPTSGPPSQRDTGDAQRSVHFERASMSSGAAFSGRNSMGRQSDGSRSSSTPSVVSSAPPSQSHLQLEANRPSGPPTHRAPPTLCKALILPHEARFVIPMTSLSDENNTWEVLGYSGRPLLRATAREMDAGRRFVEISMTPPRSPILAYAGSFPSATPGAGPALRILGAGGAPYGDLQQSPTGQQYHLMVDDMETHTIIVDASGQLVFYGPDGVNLATMNRGIEGGKPSAEIRVIPEVDSILVLSCALAILIFGGDAGGGLMRSR